MYHFYLLKETDSLNMTESVLILEHVGSYPNLRSYARGLSDQHFSFIAV
jgi:hypothetical protein